MPQFQYTSTQNRVETKPVNFNRIQPNLSTSKAIDNLSNAILGGMKLTTQVKDQINEEDYLREDTKLTKDLLKSKEDFDKGYYEERGEFLKKYDEVYLKPFEGEGKYNSKLYNKALSAKEAFLTAYNKQTIGIRDNSLLTEAYDSLLTNGEFNGVPDKETWDNIVNTKLSKISTWATDSGTIKQKFSQQAMYVIANNFKDKERTWENYNVLKDQVEQLQKLDPKIAGSETFSKLMTTVNSFKNVTNTKDLGNLSADLTNDNVSIGAFTASSKILLDRGAISQQQHDNNIFMKELKLVQKDYTNQAKIAYTNEDDESLVKLQENGKGSAVKKVVTDNLNIELSNQLLKNNGKPGALEGALDVVMKKFDQKQKLGLDMGKLDYVEAVLNSPKTGGLQTEADIQTYLTVMEKAQKYNYYSPSMKVNQADYIVLKTMNKLKLPDMVARYQSYKTSNIRVTQAQIDEVYNDAVDNDIFSRNLSQHSEAQIRSVLNPTIKALIKAGIDPDDLDEELDNALIGPNGAFFEAGGFGINSRVLIPKTGAFKSKDSYNNVVKALNNSIVLPTDPLNGNGQWMVLPKDGSAPKLYPFKYIEYLGKYGKENKSELKKIKKGE